MAIDVLVIQHGEKSRGSGDPGLTALGRQQAETVARWLAGSGLVVDSIWGSPLRRAQETAAPLAAALGREVRTDARFRERMNWDDETAIDLDGFLVEWQRATADRSYRPLVGDSSLDAAARFVEALGDIEQAVGEGCIVVVAHGGVTVDVLRSVVGDAPLATGDLDLIADGVPSCAVTRLRVNSGVVTVVELPSTDHLDPTASTPHRPA